MSTPITFNTNIYCSPTTVSAPATPAPPAVNHQAECASATKIVLSNKVPTGLFSAESANYPLIVLICQWIQRAPSTDEGFIPFLQSLRAKKDLPINLLKKHLPQVTDLFLRSLLERAPNILNENMGSIVNSGLPEAEPELLNLLKTVKLPLSEHHTIRDGIEEHFYNLILLSPYKDPLNLDSTPKILATFLEQGTAEGNSSWEKLLSLLIKKPALQCLTWRFLPRYEFTPHAEISLNAYLDLLQSHLNFELNNSLFHKTALEIKAVLGFDSEQNKNIHFYQSWLNQLVKSKLPPNTPQREVRKFIPQIAQKYERDTGKSAQDFVSAFNPTISDRYKPEVNLLKEMNHYLDSFSKKSEPRKKMLETYAKSQTANPGSLSLMSMHFKKMLKFYEKIASLPFDSRVTSFADFSFHKAKIKQLIKAIQKTILMQSNQREDPLIELDCEPEYEPKVVQEEQKINEVAEEPSVEPVPLPKAPPLPPEEIVHLNHLIKNRSEPLDGAISHYIQMHMPIENEEVANHLLLATQGLELFCDLYRQGRHDLLAVCYHSFLLDLHVAVEQYLQPGKRNKNHSLVLAAQSFALDQTDMDFLTQHKMAIYWTRYLATSSANLNGPLPARNLQSLMTTPEQSAEGALHSIIESYKGLLRFFGVHHPTLTLLLNQLQTTPPPPAQIETPVTPFDTLRDQIKATTQTAVRVRTIPEGDPVECLEEICNYLQWMKQAAQIKTLFPDQKWQFWLQRIDLHMDKLFKHLFAAEWLLYDYGMTNTHHLSKFIEVLKGEYPFDPKEIALLEEINLGLAHHYFRLLTPKQSDSIKALLKKSQDGISAPKGFSTPGKSPSPKLAKQLNEAFDLFQKYLPRTLALLQAEESKMS